MGNIIFIGTGSEWFWGFLQLFVVISSVVFLYFQIRTQTSSHVVNTLEIIRRRWDSHDMLNARVHVCQKWLSGDRKFDAGAEHVAEFFEELGLYLRMKSVPPKVL